VGALVRRTLLICLALCSVGLRPEILSAQTRPEGPPPQGIWIPGDLHLHTIHSHDVCDPTHPDSEQCQGEPWTAGFTVAQQIALAEARGLGFLSITDHNTTEHLSDLGYASDDLILLPGQEVSLHGHAGVWGYGREIDRGSSSVADVQRIIDEVHAAGGLFAINHPQESFWEYGRTPEEPVAVTGFDAVEIWNIAWQYQSEFFPFLNPADNPEALKYWESLLDAGDRVPGVGGSDSHWIATHGIQGVGQPSTWVYAPTPTRAGVLRGIRAGRVFISAEPPALLGPKLFLEADDDGDGVYATLPGSTVRSQGLEQVRVRVENGLGGTVRIVTDGGRVLATSLVTAPAQELRFALDLSDSSWVRADLYAGDPDLAMLAIASPIYVRSKG
jgi:hypothetical protein